jgi:hypothetical protein
LLYLIVQINLEIALNRGANQSTGGADTMFGYAFRFYYSSKICSLQVLQVDFNSLL